METWYYKVIRIDGDYAHLMRTDIEDDEDKFVARTLPPDEIHNYCPRCNAILDFQKGYSSSKGYWICKGCGTTLTNPYDSDFDNPSGIIWRCDACEACLNQQQGFSEKESSWKCTECGHVNPISLDDVYENEEEYQENRRNETAGMSDEDLFRLSEYDYVSELDDRHTAVLVKNRETEELFVKKYLTVFNADVYRYLKDNPIPNTPGIIELFEGKYTLIVIEEFINGVTLQELIEDGSTLKEDAAVRILIQLCDIIERLHKAPTPIIHRDIKPSNIIINDELSITLLDMNAAKWYKDNEVQDTVLIGTQEYAAPEQYGFMASSVQTDIYAMGVVLNQLVTGKFPKERKADGPIGQIVAKCTAFVPTERYDSVTELKKALEEIL